MKQTFLVNGLSCLIDGTQTYIFVQKVPDEPENPNSNWHRFIADCRKAETTVRRYLIDEGFIDCNSPVSVRHIVSTDTT